MKNPLIGAHQKSHSEALSRAKGKSWTDGLDKTKYSPEKIKKWKSDEKRAQHQFKRTVASGATTKPATGWSSHSS